MKKTKQISKILVAIIFIFIVGVANMGNTYAGVKNSPVTPYTVYADKGSSEQQNNSEKASLQDVIDAGNNWIDLGEKEQGSLTVDYFAEQFVGIGQLLVAIAVVVILIVTVITAFNWITASPDKQAKLKQQLIGLVISIIVIFGAVGIWNFVKGIMENTEDTLAGKNLNSSTYIATIQK